MKCKTGQIPFMNENTASPFEEKSSKTKRSPEKSKPNPREPSLIRGDRTRSQSVNTPPGQKAQPPIKPKKPEEFITPEPKPQTNKMDRKQIQQLIADNAIPEFSGEDTENNTSKLARFIGIADSVYKMLGTEAEKRTFTQLLKFKLTGDAYTRISHREVEDYEALKEIINNMYARTYTLNELERKFMDIQQLYGETVRNYGYRLIEALDKYKNGYKNKYTLQTIDKSYTQHLDTTAVQSFKRGLNNIILREKVATVQAKNVDTIINETELMEQMLAASTSIHNTQPTANYSHNQHTFIQPTLNYSTPNITLQQHHNPGTQNPQKNNQIRQPQIICNYCQKPNHTYEVCRTRIAAQRNAQYTNYNPHPQFNNYTNNFSKQNTTQTPQNNFIPRPTQNNNPYRTHTQNNFTQYRQPQQRNDYTPKYCSHCKTTTGHTFDECRSKFLGRKHTAQMTTLDNNHNNQHTTQITTNSSNRNRKQQMT